MQLNITRQKNTLQKIRRSIIFFQKVHKLMLLLSSKRKKLNTEIHGHIEYITFQNEENGFTVARMRETGKRDLTVIVGNMPTIKEGEALRCEGRWHMDKQYGQQFQVSAYEVKLPETAAGIRKYLASGMIKGIGSTFAQRIVDKFGKKTLEIIDQHSERLLEVEGIGKKRLGIIQKHWQEQHAIRGVMIFLQSVNVSATYAQKIYKQYGNQSIQKVKANPYHLTKDIHGIGFKISDKIARQLGIALDADERIDAGIEFALSELSGRGHTCYPLPSFVDAARQILDVATEKISARLEEVQLSYRVLIQPFPNGDEYIWLTRLFNAEKGIAEMLKKLLQTAPKLEVFELEKNIQQAQQTLQLQLAEHQQTAVQESLSRKVHIITGGPGTGKSTITKVILNIALHYTDKILLAAPTGRAAKRLSQVTGLQAITIHSLLEVDFAVGGFKRNPLNPLQGELIIIDEASMIDTVLMFHLVRAVPLDATLILVGDIDQLPSVGPGNVLRDLIASDQVPTTRLTKVFRQAATSKIITAAHQINKGELPDLRIHKESDFFFIAENDADKICNVVQSLVSRRLPDRYKFNRIDDIQVLSPMKRGILGTHHLNERLQETLNPSRDPLHKSGKRFHVQDKVMQIVNNYDKAVFNGDVGRVLEIDRQEEEIIVAFDGNLVNYEFSELDQLVLAYAVSVHKYQGSECPCVVIPIHTTHYMLLFRNLIYTGITRGKKLVVLVGMKQGLEMAVRNNRVQDRHTGLQHILRDLLSDNADQNAGLFARKVVVLNWKKEMQPIE